MENNALISAIHGRRLNRTLPREKSQGQTTVGAKDHLHVIFTNEWNLREIAGICLMVDSGTSMLPR